MTSFKTSAPMFRLRRNARALARKTGISYMAALDQIARSHGFRSWAHLMACHRREDPAKRLLAALSPGDLLLIGARPGQGKTLLALGLAVAAVRQGRRACVFTLDYSDAEVLERLRDVGANPSDLSDRLTLDTTDAICSAHIAAALANAPEGMIAVVDYLQLLDQRRAHPPLSEQLPELRRTAKARGAIIAAVSQIDRRYDPALKPLPDLDDVRLPNPTDLALFDKACFLHDGAVAMTAVA